MEEPNNIQNLFNKYLQGECSVEELDKLLVYFHAESDESLVERIEAELNKNNPYDKTLVTEIGNRVADNLFKITKPASVFPYKKGLAIAASISLIFAIGGYLFKQLMNNSDNLDQQSLVESIIQPGTNKAIITLDNGDEFPLSEKKVGLITKGNKIYYEDGSLVEGLSATQQVAITTPRAGQYAITLSDGTKVWLNAASKIKYPIAFGKKERSVEVVGEVYFEVAHDRKRPFKVYAASQEIEVLGTKFNVSAYDDDLLQTTTLLEGAVLIKSNKSKAQYRLKPGDQAIQNRDGESAIKKVDPLDYTSWKDGIIMIHTNNLSEILRQLERWYDVDFDKVPDGILASQVFGMIRRDVPLNDVLKSLRDNYTTVDFKIKGRRIMVLKK